MGRIINYFGDDTFKQIVILGLNKKILTNKDILQLGGIIAKQARKKKKVMIALQEIEHASVNNQNNLAILAQGIMIGDWRFFKI